MGPSVAVGAVVVDGEHLLLIRRGRGPGAGQWSVPGGKVLHGETLHEAVVREVAEETGLDVVVDRFLGWVERFGDTPEPYHFVILDFVAAPLDGRDARPGDDADAVAWVHVLDLGDVDLVNGLYDFLIDTRIVPR